MIKFPDDMGFPDPLSRNLYAYAHNNPIYYQDPGGYFVITTTVIMCVGLAAALGIGGGFAGNYLAEKNNVASKVKWKYITVGVVAGGAIGATGGYIAGPVIARLPVSVEYQLQLRDCDCFS